MSSSHHRQLVARAARPFWVEAVSWEQRLKTADRAADEFAEASFAKQQALPGILAAKHWSSAHLFDRGDSQEGASGGDKNAEAENEEGVAGENEQDILTRKINHFLRSAEEWGQPLLVCELEEVVGPKQSIW